MAGARITFDTNLAGVWNARVFWATLCEELGQRMMLTPTAGVEVLRRIRLETERQWTKDLKAINIAQHYGWSKVEVRRLATTAAVAARDRFKHELRKQGAIYAMAPRADEKIQALEADIEDSIPDDVFDESTDNGIRDRKIVIEALARGYDILASNNIEYVDHGALRDWLRADARRALGLSTTIMRPEEAEEHLRHAYAKPLAWTTFAAARACVTDPRDHARAAKEIAELIEPFDKRGMSGLKARIYRTTERQRDFTSVLEAIEQHGNSRAMREEQALNAASTQAAEIRAGRSIER